MKITDENTRESNFFCMELVGRLAGDSQYEEKWNQAKNGYCPFRFECKRYKKTLQKHGKQTRLNFK